MTRIALENDDIEKLSYKKNEIDGGT
jgi:hypothetical protein